MIVNFLSTAHVAIIIYVDKDKTEFLLPKDIKEFFYLRA